MIATHKNSNFSYFRVEKAFKDAGLLEDLGLEAPFSMAKVSFANGTVQVRLGNVVSSNDTAQPPRVKCQIKDQNISDFSDFKKKISFF